MRDAIRFRYVLLQMWWYRTLQRAAMQLAWRLPRYVAYWAFIRVAAYATTGRYGTTDPTTLSVMDALKRWDAPA